MRGCRAFLVVLGLAGWPSLAAAQDARERQNDFEAWTRLQDFEADRSDLQMIDEATRRAAAQARRQDACGALLSLARSFEKQGDHQSAAEARSVHARRCVPPMADAVPGR